MRWGFVSVTDLVAQSWCEQKLVYSYFPPTPEYEMVPLEEIAPAVAAGQQIHQVFNYHTFVYSFNHLQSQNSISLVWLKLN